MDASGIACLLISLIRTEDHQAIFRSAIRMGQLMKNDGVRFELKRDCEYLATVRELMPSPQRYFALRRCCIMVRDESVKTLDSVTFLDPS
ncbi:hypothetical protein ASH00_06750 [Arthrobacter sp. Soil782]|nr:hypothetical protein ASH00_06750 [Arthrobacter sp. Soil782]